ncbi:hypothetical protein ACFW04_011924 [Cataglyphis niger]
MYFCDAKTVTHIAAGCDRHNAFYRIMSRGACPSAYREVYRVSGKTVSQRAHREDVADTRDRLRGFYVNYCTSRYAIFKRGIDFSLNDMNCLYNRVFTPSSRVILATKDCATSILFMIFINYSSQTSAVSLALPRKKFPSYCTYNRCYLFTININYRPLQYLNHPFHLHGYSFCVMYAGQFVNALNKNDITNKDVMKEIEAHMARLQNGYYTHCSPKDTVIVPNTGFTILRFKADNPGWWFFHCHFTWHTATGMNVVLHVGTSYDLPPVPPNFPKCNNWTPRI